MKKLLLFISFFILNNSMAFVVYQDTKIWQQDSITIYFKDGTETQKNEVKEFAKIWERYSGIKFNYTDQKPSVFNFKKFYTLTFKGSGNESTRGAINGTIKLGNLATNIIFRKTTILHEFGHMLGLGHEHQRSDRPASLNNTVLINKCIEHQQQSRYWCENNFSLKNRSKVFIESDYDFQSIMHYGLNGITGGDVKLLQNIPDSNANSLSYTDKYYIAMLYNQNISDRTLEKMHQQDLWMQQKFELKANNDRNEKIQSLVSSSCKTLIPQSYSDDDKYCNTGYMVIGSDNISFPEEEFKVCHISYDMIEDIVYNHELCQLDYYELKLKRRLWNNAFESYGQCKRLETNIKNNQEYFCKNGYSFVTKDNNMIGGKTQCFSSTDIVFDKMKQNPICNLDNLGYSRYKENQKNKLKQQSITRTCQVVAKKYETVNCPTGFDYTIIDRRSSTKPINRQCFPSVYQAIKAMNEISACQG